MVSPPLFEKKESRKMFQEHEEQENCESRKSASKIYENVRRTNL